MDDRGSYNNEHFAGKDFFVLYYSLLGLPINRCKVKGILRKEIVKLDSEVSGMYSPVTEYM